MGLVFFCRRSLFKIFHHARITTYSGRKTFGFDTWLQKLLCGFFSQWIKSVSVIWDLWFVFVFYIKKMRGNATNKSSSISTVSVSSWSLVFVFNQFNRKIIIIVFQFISIKFWKSLIRHSLFTDHITKVMNNINCNEFWDNYVLEFKYCLR